MDWENGESKGEGFFLGGWYYEYEEKVFGDNECCEEDKK